MTDSDLARFQSKTDRASSPCWQWLGNTNSKGYGTMYTSATRTTQLVHRLAYKHWKGPIPLGLELDHLCRNRQCANPDHLEAVTHATNLARGYTIAHIRRAMTHCKHGHPFDDANTYARR